MIETNTGRTRFDGTGIELTADIGCIVRGYRDIMYETYTESFALDRLRELEDIIIDALYMDDDDYHKKLAEGLS